MRTTTDSELSTHATGIVLASVVLAILGTAIAGFALHVAVGPPGQRIHIRYAAATSTEERIGVERQFGLIDAVLREQRTWSYRLRDRSSGNLAALIAHPAVEDTHFLDRARRRVILEQPELPDWLRRVLETDRTPAGALVLAIAALLVAWRSRRRIRAALPVLTVAREHRHAATLGLTGVLTLFVLAVTVEAVPDDSTFVHLYQAPSILAGDHPYRDFFEWGAPLPAYASAGMQILVGYRVIGELLLQWSVIAASVMLAFHLALRQSGSPLATLLMLPIALLLLAKTGTYHYSKLFWFPFAIWLAWRYVERPTRRRSAALGLGTGVAFLVRHDYVLWTGLASALALALAPLAAPKPGSLRKIVTHSALSALMAMAVVSPWALIVQRSEGLVTFTQARLERFAYSRGAGPANPYVWWLSTNPLDAVRRPIASPTSGLVSFEWAPEVTAEHQQYLERQFALEPVARAATTTLHQYRFRIFMT